MTFAFADQHVAVQCEMHELAHWQIEVNQLAR